MSEVYKARDPRLGRDVAIKFASERFTDRFGHEARAIASLKLRRLMALLVLQFASWHIVCRRNAFKVSSSAWK
jgi:hypothetical protein